MAELEPGHPDELRDHLINWLNQATSPIGSLPPGMSPAEWAARNFIDAWRKPLRESIDQIELLLRKAIGAIQSQRPDDAVADIEGAMQEIRETVRDELGLYDWNREGEA